MRIVHRGNKLLSSKITFNLILNQSQRDTKTGVLALVTGVRFWAGVSVLALMISLALPWWGVEATPISSFASSWGPIWGPPDLSSLQEVAYNPKVLDQNISANYPLIASLIFLTSLLVVLGAGLKRASLLALAPLLSLGTGVAFIASVVQALTSAGCPSSYRGCVSVIGQGISGSLIITWGFKFGFYLFIASGFLMLATLALQRSKDW